MKHFALLLASFFILTHLCLPLAVAQTISPAPINPLSAKEQEKQPLKLPGINDKDPSKYIQQKFIPAVTNAIIASSGGFALLFVIIGGIQMLTAYGNDEKITTAKKTLTWALAGLLIAILSYSIVQILVSISVINNPPPK